MVIDGQTCEKMFESVMSERGHKVEKSSRQDDMYKHFDFIIDGKTKVDVKSEKKLNRWDEDSSSIFWIEALNVRGNIGWLFGEADYIAFFHNDSFLMVELKDLQKLVLKINPDYIKPSASKAYKKWYRRNDRLDSVMYLYEKDILPIVKQKINVN